MKVDFFPVGSGRLPPPVAAPFSREWVLELIQRRGGGPTIREILENERSASCDSQRTIDAFRSAFEDGDIECHHANAGKKGRPRYEFRVAKK